MKKIILIIFIFFIIVGIAMMTCKLGENDSNTVKQSSNTKISYSINNNMSNYNSKYKQRGVHYDTLNQPDAPHYYTIAMGEKNSGGYLINIKDVNIDESGNVEVIVQETRPKSGETTTMAFTYPICMLELDKYPNSIVVRNTEGEKFKNINF